MDTKRDAYVEKLKGKIDGWNADIDKLEAKAHQVKADVKVKYEKQIDDLKAKRDEVQAKMGKLQKAGEGAWEDLKSGVDVAWKAFGESVKSAKSRFK